MRRKWRYFLGVFFAWCFDNCDFGVFEGFARYLVMYLGIAVDIILPLFLAKTLRKVPVDFRILRNVLDCLLLLHLAKASLRLLLF